MRLQVKYVPAQKEIAPMQRRRRETMRRPLNRFAMHSATEDGFDTLLSALAREVRCQGRI